MRDSGFHNFPATDRVVYGKPAADALKEEVARLNAKRVFLITSRTLNTKTDEIEKIRSALGDRYVATLDGIAQHTPRKQAANAALAARDAKADLLVAIGGGYKDIFGVSTRTSWPLIACTAANRCLG